jgi:hypothetical protein
MARRESLWVARATTPPAGTRDGSKFVGERLRLIMPRPRNPRPPWRCSPIADERRRRARGFNLSSANMAPRWEPSPTGFKHSARHADLPVTEPRISRPNGGTHIAGAAPEGTTVVGSAPSGGRVPPDVPAMITPTDVR